MLKRINLSDQIYFITSKTCQAEIIFDQAKNCKLFLEVLRDCKLKYKFKLYSFVIMPNHVHLLIRPAKDFTVSQVMQKIKSIFAKELKKCLAARVAASLARGGSDSKTVAYAVAVKLKDNKTVANAHLIKPGQAVWQKSFYDHVIRNDLDFIEKLNYIHKNPLKHGLTNSLDDYPWSSYHYYFSLLDQARSDLNPAARSQNNSLIELDNINL